MSARSMRGRRRGRDVAGDVRARAARASEVARNAALQLGGVEALRGDREVDDPLAQRERLEHAGDGRLGIGGLRTGCVSLWWSSGPSARTPPRRRRRDSRRSAATTCPRSGARRSASRYGSSSPSTVLVNTSWLVERIACAAASGPGTRARGRCACARSAGRRARASGLSAPTGSAVECASRARRLAARDDRRDDGQRVGGADVVAVLAHQSCACDSVRNRS